MFCYIVTVFAFSKVRQLTHLEFECNKHNLIFYLLLLLFSPFSLLAGMTWQVCAAAYVQSQQNDFILFIKVNSPILI